MNSTKLAAAQHHGTEIRNVEHRGPRGGRLILTLVAVLAAIAVVAVFLLTSHRSASTRQIAPRTGAVHVANAAHGQTPDCRPTRLVHPC